MHMYNAIGMIEFTSISRGIYVTDQMLKASEVEAVSAVSVCPGKYIAILRGDVAAVENSIERGLELAGEYLVDTFVLPNAHPDIFPAITATTVPEQTAALGILEAFSMACMITAADAALKAADIHALELRMGSGLGGKAYFTFTGDVAAVEAGLEAGKNVIAGKGLLVNAEIIPSPSGRLWTCLF